MYSNFGILGSRVFRLYAFLYLSLKAFFISFHKYIPDLFFFIRYLGITESDCNHHPVYVKLKDKASIFVVSGRAWLSFILFLIKSNTPQQTVKY